LGDVDLIEALTLCEKTMTTVVFSGTGEFLLEVMPERKKWIVLTSLKALLTDRNPAPRARWSKNVIRSGRQKSILVRTCRSISFTLKQRQPLATLQRLGHHEKGIVLAEKRRIFQLQAGQTVLHLLVNNKQLPAASLAAVERGQLRGLSTPGCYRA
jgi:hypothetical protein